MSESSFDKNLKKAEDAIRKNNAEYAIQILNTQLLKTQPDHMEANEVYYRAVKAKWKAKGKLPKPAWLKTKTLQAYQMAKRWDGLAEAARNQYADDPANGKVLELLAESMINLGNWNAAYAALVQLTEGGVDPKSAIGWFWKARCQDQLGDIGAAIDSCNRAKNLDNNKEFGDYYKSLSAKQAFEANKDKKGVTEVAGGEDKIKATIADRGRQGKDYLMEQVEKLGGDDATEKNDVREIARLYEKAGEFAKSVKAWNKFYELTQDPQALDEAGDMTLKHYAQMVDKARAAGADDKVDEFRKKLLQFKVQEFSRRVQQRPTDLGLWLDYGSVLYEAGKFSDAAKALQKASKDPKKAGVAALMLGRSFYEIDRHDLAIMQFDKAMEEHQSDEERLETMYWKAKAMLGKGMEAEAREVFLQIQMEDFDYQDVQDILNGMPG